MSVKDGRAPRFPTSFVHMGGGDLVEQKGQKRIKDDLVVLNRGRERGP